MSLADALERGARSGHICIVRTSFIACLVFAAACGGSTPKTDSPAPATATAAEEPVVGPPDVAWKDMSKEQRGKFMAKVVMPKMKELFTTFDPKTFAEVNCKTCHGEGAVDKTFKMPNPDIAALPTTSEAFEALAKEKPEVVKFMATQVKPQMAALLGIEEFDPASPKEGTFGCYACHTTEKPGT